MPLEQPLQCTHHATEEHSRTPFHFPSNRYENAANINCPEPTHPSPVWGRQPICKAVRKHVPEQGGLQPAPQSPSCLQAEAGATEAALNGGFTDPPGLLCSTQEHRSALEGEHRSYMCHRSHTCSLYHRWLIKEHFLLTAGPPSWETRWAASCPVLAVQTGRCTGQNSPWHMLLHLHTRASPGCPTDAVATLTVSISTCPCP